MKIEIDNDGRGGGNQNRLPTPQSLLTLQERELMMSRANNNNNNSSISDNIFNCINQNNEQQAITLLTNELSLLFATEDHYGLTILHLASQKRMVRLVESIVQLATQNNKNNDRFRSFDFNILDNNNNTPLHYCCSTINNGNSNNSNNSISTTNSNILNETVRSSSSSSSSSSSIQSGFSLNNPWNTSNQIGGGYFESIEKVDDCSYDICKILLENGARYDSVNNVNFTPILLASKNGLLRVVRLLLDAGADASLIHKKVIDSNQFSLQLKSLLPLTKYESNRQEERKSLVINKLSTTNNNNNNEKEKKEKREKKNNTNTTTTTVTTIKNGPTCLHYLLSNVNLLLEELQFKLLGQEKEKDECLTTVVEQLVDSCKWLGLVNLLLDSNTSVNSVDETTGRTAFSSFICNWTVQPIIADQDGNLLETTVSPRMLACLSLVVQRLITALSKHSFDFNQCDLNSIDSNIEGETPLIYTTQFTPSNNTSKRLLFDELLYFFTKTKNEDENKSSRMLESKNQKGQTALFVSSQLGNSYAMVRLLSAGSNVDESDTYGNTALHESIMFGHYEIACQLVRCGANVNLPMSIYPQSYPIHLASTAGDLELLDCLLQHGALIDSKDGERRTAQDLSTDNEEVSLFLDMHIQVTLVHHTSLVIPKSDFTNHLQSKINYLYPNNYNNNNKNNNNNFKIEKDVDKLIIHLNNQNNNNQNNQNNNNNSIRIGIRKKNDQLFKIINLNQRSYYHLKSIIYQRLFTTDSIIVTPSSTSTNLTEQQEIDKKIQNITLLPDILISDDTDLLYLKDGDRLEID
ncbi:hypothetical protein DFA_09721 [Cavenderia fasciculata]|uniref:Ankyrin repeat-containing protein n=1 Tax=Cavenderia fasciculata TaxID=261658 RepID=F4Q8E9_CACFS|nr:uncharacterized protein DFA_09721 [Cavenderia fasciculata]EGG16049.1 hypothetical protein DFA_09721 [Cavenderia fasciculata]|eukprot:XP_004352374.1 hypothetical protein DFA_09721 [Cavenderia fasciculata]